MESIKKSLEVALSLGSEGVVLKYYNSSYNVASRNNNWIKVKPEYLEEFGENLDLIVIGRDFGKKDSFMLGLLVLDEEEYKKHQGDSSEIVDHSSQEKHIQNSRRRVKKYFHSLYRKRYISRRIQRNRPQNGGHWKRTSEVAPPASILEFGSKIPAEWIDPSESIVLEIKSRSLDNTETNMQKYATNCTLYGGYCKRIRYDKEWTDCYTLNDLYESRTAKLIRED